MMKKILTAILSGVAALSMTLSAFAAVPVKYGVIYDRDETVTFIVEVEGDALLASEAAEELGTDYINTSEAQKQETQMLNTQARVMSEIRSKAKVKEDKGYTYTAVLNGFSIDAPESKMDEIKALPGVKNVYEAVEMKPMLASAVKQTSSLPADTKDDITPDGYSGEGQLVAIIDSEFDTGHEFFSNAPKNPKLSKSDIAGILADKTMNVDVAANQVYRSEKIPFAYDYVNKTADTYNTPTDTIHGTHVAGITAGKNGSISVPSEAGEPVTYPFSGVAPEAQLVLMKVSADNGGIATDGAIAAMDDAVKFGVCAINMSFGSDYYSKASNTLYDEVINNTKNAGVLMSIANGNAGMGYNSSSSPVQMPDYMSAGTPCGYSAATAIASVNNTHVLSNIGTLTMADGTELNYKNASGERLFGDIYAGREVEYVNCGLGSPNDFQGKNLNGKIALIGRGDLLFVEKADNAKAAGAEAMILYDNTADGIDTVVNIADLSLPTAVIERSSGKILKSADIKTITVHKVTEAYILSSGGGAISSFSSWGVDETLELKPEIAAPGGNILSSVPDNKYEVFSGTSMAAPHITGVAALMNEYFDQHSIALHGAARVNRIENMLMSTANIVYQPEKDGGSVPYSPRVQGAGLVNTAAAMKTPAILIGDSPKTKISLGDKLGDSFTLRFTIQNLTDEDVTYDDVSLDVLTDGYETNQTDGQYDIVLDNSVQLGVVSNTLPETVTVPADGTVNISAEVTLDSAELAENSQIFTNGFFIDGFVTLGKSDESIPDISMPFTGFRGDWTAAPVFDKTMYDEGGSVLYSENSDNLKGTYIMTTVTANGTEYIVKNGMTYGGAFDKTKIAISPNGDGIKDSLGIKLTTWRAVKNITYELASADGRVATEDDLVGVWAKYLGGDLWLDEVENMDETALPDGEYTLTLSGAFNYDDAETETLAFPIVVDREQPEIKHVSVENDILTVTASDNSYLQLIDIMYHDKNGESMQDDVVPAAEKGGLAVAEFDIAGIDPDDITIEVWDYADNGAVVNLTNAIGVIMADMTDYTAVKAMTSAAVALTNISGSVIESEAIIAFYGENGKLIALSSQNVSIGAGETTECKFNMFADTQNAVAAKLFIWSDIDTMQPKDNAKTFDLA